MNKHEKKSPLQLCMNLREKIQVHYLYYESGQLQAANKSVYTIRIYFVNMVEIIKMP